MRKSLFSKIFITQLLVSLTIIFLVVPTLFLLIGDYFISEQEELILQDAVRVAKLTEHISEYELGAEAWEIFEKGIEFAGSQSIMVVLNAEGKILSEPENSAGINISNIGKEYVDLVRSGESVVKVYYKDDTFNEQTLVAIAPIEDVDAVSGKVEFLGASMALRPMPQIQSLQNRIITIVMMAQTTAWVLAFVVSFFLTRQILKPIKKMRTAAKSIASGNFQERIPVTSADEIGQLAQTFNSMIQSLDELEKMRASFISDVSHELRTPMTIIGGFVEGILDGTIAEEQKTKYLDIVLSEIKRLSRLVNDLLESSRLEQGKIKIEKTNVDMNRITAECIIAYEKSLTDKKINVNLELDEEECFALADKDAIKRVMINLIDNAIKFTPEGGDIEVTTEKTNGKVKVSVKNSGEGISKDELRHIWERFYKSDKSRSFDKKGVGLGLHIVKTIISQHGGEIYAESEEGSFACFTFILDEGIQTKKG
ncbi:MAG: HAMP domain-containing histidine kinase [Clostridia bacterium]|nr:HAMP domain-containing histidine kinase [Clostridia bacterium]